MDVLDRIIAREGGAKITRDPHDPGGVTKFGISKRAYPDVDIENLTYEQAKDIYIRDYFVGTRVIMLPVELQEPVLDFCVHSGPSHGVRYLQKVLGVQQDGRIGPKTLAAVRAGNIPAILAAYQRERVLFLCRQVVAKPIKLKYLVGWVARVMNL